MKQIKYTIISLAILALFAACSNDSPNADTNQKVVPVKLEQVKAYDVAKLISASGNLAAVKSANISTRMMGYVSQFNVKLGQQVKKGEVLLHIRNLDLLAKKAQIEASISKANSAYTNAERDLERFKVLHAQKSASDKELENISSQYEMTKANLEQARQMKKEIEAQFAYLNIEAPFSGRVINTFVKEGDMANPGIPLLSLESTAAIEAVVMVSEEDIESVAPGMKAKVYLKSLNREVSGKVSEVSYSSQHTGGQYLVKIMLDTVADKMLSGMFVNVKIEGNNKAGKSKIMLAEKSLVHKGQLSGIYTPSGDSTAILRWLRLGKKMGGQVEVLSGLSAGESYILEAEGKLYNGVPITY